MVEFLKSLSLNSLGSWGEVQRARDLLSGQGAEDLQDSSQEPVASSTSKELFKLFIYAGMNEREIRNLTVRVVLALAFGAFLLIVSGKFLVLIIPAIICGIEYLRVAAKTHRRAESFERDYTALLLSLASAIKTGLDPLVALTGSAQLFAKGSEVRRELMEIKRGIDAGVSEEKVIQAFAQTIRHPDIALFRMAFILARREGSSLSECLHRLARVTRNRQSFRRKARAAVAMQKLSAFAIVGCCAVIGAIQFTSNPEGFHKAMQDPMGMKIMGAGVFLLTFGVIWMLRIAKSRI